MAGRRPTYTAEYKKQMVELVRAGRAPVELAEEYGVTAQSIRTWVHQADRLEGQAAEAGMSVVEYDELKRLRREVKVLREEKEILKKAAVWFARENGRPEGSSSS